MARKIQSLLINTLHHNFMFPFFLMSLLIFNIRSYAETNLIYEWVGETNLVVSVAGYKTTCKLANGMDIPVFSVSNENKDHEQGVLFYVIAPTNYAGHFFWMHHDGLAASGRLTALYNTNTLYYFSFQKSGGTRDDLTLEDLNDLFKYGKGVSHCSVGGVIGWQYFTSRDEAENYLRGLLKEQEDAKAETVLVGERFQRAEKPPILKEGEQPELTTEERRKKYSEYFSARQKLRYLEASIKCRAREIAEVQHQIERMSIKAK